VSKQGLQKEKKDELAYIKNGTESTKLVPREEKRET